MKLFDWIKLTWTGLGARREYVDIDRQLDAIYDELAETDRAATRAVLLAKCGKLTLAQADVYTAGWGDDPLDDGMDMAQSLRWSAMLYRHLADVEQAVAYQDLGRRQYASAVLGVEADDLLSRMAATPDLDARMALLDGLYEAVLGKVGGQAAEMAIACLPYPKTTEVAR